MQLMRVADSGDRVTMPLPRVWLVPYRRAWCYDITARALVRHLSHRFEFRLAYTDEIMAGQIEEWPADAIVDMWWHGTMHHRVAPYRVIKQVSSHRWRQQRWGSLKPGRMLSLFAGGAGAVVVPSHRLFAELATAADHSDLHIAAKGFDPRLFANHDVRNGCELTVGWAGASEAKDKNVDTLVEAFPDVRLADECLTQDEMGDFYNGCDVVAIASSAEGDPRPLIEGMACGCFPVTTDVGIVPELVEHGVNGLIVGREPGAFELAFAWCAAHLETVRAAGRRNADMMARTRTWAHVAPMWGDVIESVVTRVVRIQGLEDDSQAASAGC